MNAKPASWQDFCLDDLTALISESILTRGRDYHDRSRVGACLRAGGRLAGSVLGSAGWYVVAVSLIDGEIRGECTCPYQGPLCKHAAALILTWLSSPGRFVDIIKAVEAMEEDPAGLKRLCLELSLAAPQKAAALLAGAAAPEVGENAASLARNLLAHPNEVRDAGALGERLAWVVEQLAAALAGHDAQAAEAAVDLAGKLLTVCCEAGGRGQLADLAARYLLRLAEAWPGDGDGLIDPGRVRSLFKPETKPFMGEIGRLFLAAGGEVRDRPERGSEDELLALLKRGSMRELVENAAFENLSLLMDAFERWDEKQRAAALARAALRRTDPAERYVLRRRLARLHLESGQRRQAAAYLRANFGERPDPETWSLLREASLGSGEWPRVKKGVWPVVLGGSVELRVKAALDENDAALLRSLSESLSSSDRQAAAVWSALADHDADRALGLLVEGARDQLAESGHSGRRRAAELLRAAGRVCRTRGMQARWEEIKAGLREEFAPALNWPELGSLLVPEPGVGGGGKDSM